MRLVIAFVTGGLFGLGLVISGMTDTTKVQGWLDVFGNWDPTLAFVLGGAILPMLIAWRVAERRKTAILGTPIPAPSDPLIDRRLVTGSIMFGAGWALVGFCPGPAMASLGFGGLSGVIFMAAMMIGMGAARIAPLPAKAAA